MYKSALSSLSPENYPFDLDLLPQPVYLVGGAVRDGILGRKREYLDLDFILPQDAVKTAKKLATHYKAGFVLLDKKRQIARVVFPNATVDIAQQEGDNLETDLRRRDFTVNAIAFNPHTQEIIDPLQGYDDIEKRLLRMVSSKNLEDDPLRLMRGYRQAAQLGFNLDGETQVAIRQLAPLLCKVAAERFRTELGYMLVDSPGTQWIIRAWEDGLLAAFFKNVTTAGCEYLLKVEAAAVKLSQTWQQLGIELNKYVRDTVKTNWLGIAKLACLVSPEPETAEIELTQLTYSRAEIKGVTTALKLFPKLNRLQMPLREQYFLFQEAGLVFPTTSILAVAHDTLVEGIAPLISRYLNPDDPVAHPTPLLSGKEIILALNIPASPVVGDLLTEIAIAQVEGKIATEKEAIAFARQLIK
ncbi:CCA tRNA nucleotidyltransferase [Calothrix sp. UHCC 0171]|uniref:CCA tRNA nucleotidyltransferase n=1 Tax=Calothrix sp. UHCC 0171 TaxID=3110245 RepID=UPI002B21A9AB|nr:CCA tRNA nucleotidyltransferase [Calothrix sp. UHCC 0171]MEA5573222.1 CCA tRNA nucleotidyltransferase [Calothrix sp. UHCC 0171]